MATRCFYRVGRDFDVTASLAIAPAERQNGATVEHRVRVRTLPLVAATVVALLAASCSSSTTRTSTPRSASAEAPCSWPTIANRTVNNIAYPDTNATYWVLGYRLAPGENLELRGAFPAARYISFITYGPSGGVIDVLTDRDIRPDAGSSNPFLPTARGPGAEHRYRVQVRSTASDAPNTVSAVDATSTAESAPTDSGVRPLGTGTEGAPGVVTGTLIYRLYVPDRASDPTGGAPLPAVTLRRPNGAPVTYATCAKQGRAPNGEAIVRKNGPATDRQAPAEPVFIRPASNGNNLYPNPDNVYVATITHYEPGRLVVVRGHAPTFPDTRAGAVISGQEQVRYWSMCTNEYRKPYPVSACVADQSVKLDANGDYAFVVSTRAERPANATAADGVTWIDWGSTKVDMLLLLRNMLANPDFVESAIRLAPGALATSTMGRYAPRGTYCPVATFEQGGLAAC